MAKLSKDAFIMAANAVKGNKVISVQVDPDTLDETITVNGNFSKACDCLVQEEGLETAWEFLTKDVKAAHSAIADRHVRGGK